MARFVLASSQRDNAPLWINLDLVTSVRVRDNAVLFEFEKDHGLLIRAESDVEARELMDNLLGLA